MPAARRGRGDQPNSAFTGRQQRCLRSSRLASLVRPSAGVPPRRGQITAPRDGVGQFATRPPCVLLLDEVPAGTWQPLRQPSRRDSRKPGEGAFCLVPYPQAGCLGIQHWAWHHRVHFLAASSLRARCSVRHGRLRRRGTSSRGATGCRQTHFLRSGGLAEETRGLPSSPVSSTSHWVLDRRGCGASFSSCNLEKKCAHALAVQHSFGHHPGRADFRRS